MTSQPLFILLCSGEHEKIQMAAMMASVGAVSDRAVHVFVSMNAMFAFDGAAPPEQRYKGGAFSALLTEKGAPDAITLFEQGKMLGDLKMYACSMALDVAEWDEDRLVDGLFDETMGLTKFLSDAEGGQFVTL
ncbi:MAG: DsrE/DsrF/DrsH-like family protein [Alphaproteobacteria bacterium]|nr:DsrE/DsrF/DrsH-like family protein [Alphaproteobacteria bacterium]